MPWGEDEHRDFDNESIKGKRYITFKEVREYGYVNAIEKVMQLMEPFKTTTFRSKDMTGRRFIRDGYRGSNTDFEIEIWKVEKTQFIKLTEEQCKADIATNNPPISRSYKQDMFHILHFLHGSLYFPSTLYINHIRPVVKNRQISLDGKVLGRKF